MTAKVTGRGTGIQAGGAGDTDDVGAILSFHNCFLLTVFLLMTDEWKLVSLGSNDIDQIACGRTFTRTNEMASHIDGGGSGAVRPGQKWCGRSSAEMGASSRHIDLSTTTATPEGLFEMRMEPSTPYIHEHIHDPHCPVQAAVCASGF